MHFTTIKALIPLRNIEGKKNPRAVLFLGVYLCTSWLEMQKQGGGVGGFGFGVTHKMAEQMY